MSKLPNGWYLKEKAFGSRFTFNQLFYERKGKTSTDYAMIEFDKRGSLDGEHRFYIYVDGTLKDKKYSKSKDVIMKYAKKAFKKY